MLAEAWPGRRSARVLLAHAARGAIGVNFTGFGARPRGLEAQDDQDKGGAHGRSPEKLVIPALCSILGEPRHEAAKVT